MSSTVHHHSRSHPDRPAVGIVRDPANRSTALWWTYADLDREARAVATHLGARVTAGARALLLYPTSGQFVTALLGCLYAGVIAVPAPLPGRFAHSRRRVANMVRDADVTVVLTDSTLAPQSREWAEAHAVNAPVLAHDEVASHEHPMTEPLETGPGATAMLQYTSGSTGEPKGSVVTHDNLVANAATVMRTFGLNHRDRFGGWIPNYHDMGIGMIMPPLLAGGSTVLMDPSIFLRRPGAWLTMIGAYSIRLTAAPNFGYDLCCRRLTDAEVAGLDLSSLRHAINGSEPVHGRVVTTFNRRFAPAGLRPDVLVPSYGMAEATVFVSASPNRPAVIGRFDGEALAAHRLRPAGPGAPHRELVSCGRPRDLDVRIVDPASGAVHGDGEIGEIWLRGPSVVAGYWGNPTATASSFDARVGDETGFHRTGDLGALVDGELYVTGRIKEMLIVRGRNIYPHDVEQEVRLHHDLLTGGWGAAIAIPAETAASGEELVLLHEVAGRPSPEVLAATAMGIRQTVVREFGVRCNRVVLLRRGGIRRTTSGKVERSEMCRAFLAGELQPLFDDAPAVGEWNPAAR